MCRQRASFLLLFPFLKMFSVFWENGSRGWDQPAKHGGLAQVGRQQGTIAADGQRLFGVTVGKTGNAHESIIGLIHRLSHPHWKKKNEPTVG